MSLSPFAAVILAAGSGTRMKSAIPKVMHPIAGRPMIAYPLEALRPLSPAATLVVIGPRMESVAAIVAPAECVVQDPPLGTGDAVRTAMRALDGRLAPQGPIEDVLVLYGDTPFLATETLSRLPAEELLGVNTRAELAEAEALMQHRLRRVAMDWGVTLIAPETVFLSADTRLGRDVVVEPNVTFGPCVTVGEGARICSFSYLEGAAVGEGARVGPFARLRPGAVLEEEVHVGNFVEVKAARLGAGAKANHLSYIGDSDIGARTNIGAGTITCNYDGVNKFRTIIGEDAFIGSNTALVAPVAVGDGAIGAAGSVVTRDVPADALTIARGQQVDKPGRAAEIRARLRRKN